MESHLLQMRGLKHFWDDFSLRHVKSHLLQMRGLKQAYSEGKSLDTVSHLLQMRGLKLTRVQEFFRNASRIFYRCVD